MSGNRYKNTIIQSDRQALMMVHKLHFVPKVYSICKKIQWACFYLYFYFSSHCLGYALLILREIFTELWREGLELFQRLNEVVMTASTASHDAMDVLKLNLCDLAALLVSIFFICDMVVGCLWKKTCFLESNTLLCVLLSFRYDACSYYDCV